MWPKGGAQFQVNQGAVALQLSVAFGLLQHSLVRAKASPGCNGSQPFADSDLIISPTDRLPGLSGPLMHRQRLDCFGQPASMVVPRLPAQTNLPLVENYLVLPVKCPGY